MDKIIFIEWTQYLDIDAKWKAGYWYGTEMKQDEEPVTDMVENMVENMHPGGQWEDLMGNQGLVVERKGWL
jgi:hypothetical protein